MTKRFAILNELDVEVENRLSISLEMAIKEATQLVQQSIDEGDTHPYSLYVVEIKALVKPIRVKSSIGVEYY